jgi:CTP:molybdopterin cytidylyltransferase MocA
VAPLAKEDQVSAILLAAGRSKRMGAFKPLLPFGDSTVIESCIGYLRQGGIDEIVVVVGHRSEEIKHQLKDAGLTFVTNPDPASEMSASIAHGVQHLSASVRATLIALTDQPAIPSSVIPLLVAEWRTGQRIIKPEFEGRGGHPVLIDLAFAKELLHLDPEGGLKQFFRAHEKEVRRIPVESPLVARDMDTWDDYLALHREIFGFGPKLSSGALPN